MVTFRVINKDHLSNFIIPVFDKYSMFSNKQYDYLRFKNILLSGIIYYDDLPKYYGSNKSFNTIESIINTSYFSVWLIGFIETKGCFSIYKNNNYLIASFNISQTNGDILIYAIRKYFFYTTTVYLDKINNSRLKVTNVRSIENK